MVKAKKHERVLDSLAFMLQGNDECAAIFVENGALYIASNKIYDYKPQNAHTIHSRHIEFVADTYISFGLSNANAPTSDEKEKFRKVYRQVCSFTIKDFNAKNKNFQIGNAKLSKIAKACLNKRRKDVVEVKDSWIKKTLEIDRVSGALRTDVTIAVDVCSRVANLHKRVTQSFRTGKLSSVKESVILNIGQSGEHAELKILGHLIKTGRLKDQKSDPVYIGISKKCCLNCQAVMEATNQVLGGDKIKETPDAYLVNHAGDHGVAFNGWKKPSFFAWDNPLCKAIEKQYNLIVKSQEETAKTQQKQEQDGEDMNVWLTDSDRSVDEFDSENSYSIEITKKPTKAEMAKCPADSVVNFRLSEWRTNEKTTSQNGTSDHELERVSKVVKKQKSKTPQDAFPETLTKGYTAGLRPSRQQRVTKVRKALDNVEANYDKDDTITFGR